MLVATVVIDQSYLSFIALFIAQRSMKCTKTTELLTQFLYFMNYLLFYVVATR